MSEEKTASYIIPLKRRPLVGLCVCYICGIWVGITYGVPIFPFIVAYFSVLLIACVVYAWGWSRNQFDKTIPIRIGNLLCLVCTFLAGCCVTQLHPLNPRYSSVMPYHLNFLDSLERNDSIKTDYSIDSQSNTQSSVSSQMYASRNVPCYLRGTILWEPDIYLLRDGSTWLIKFPVRIEKLIVKDYNLSVEGRRIDVLMYSSTNSVPLEYGMQIRMKGTLTRNKSASRYVSWQGNYRIQTRNTSIKILSHGYGDAFLAWCFANRRQVSRYLQIGIEKYPAVSAVLRAVLLGDDTDMRREWKNIFFETGTLHIFAISGLHIAMLALIMTILLGSLGIQRTEWILFVGPVILIYTLATGARASAVRACIMTLMYLSAPLFKRQFDILSAVACASIFITTVDPSQLWNIGFLLSFICVIGLIAFCPRFEHTMKWVGEPDPMRLEMESRRRRMMRNIAKYFVSLASATTAGWLASAPLTAYFFGVVTPVALIGNLIAVPLAFLVVLAGCLSIILGSWCTWFADIFNHANVILVSILMWFMDMFRRIPKGSFEVRKMEWYTVWIIYAILLALVFALYIMQSKIYLTTKKQQEEKNV